MLVERIASGQKKFLKGSKSKAKLNKLNREEEDTVLFNQNY